MSQRNLIRVLLLDGDEKFGERLAARLPKHHFDFHQCESLFALGSVGRLGDYDLILADPATGPVNGLEIAEYAETLFPGLPVLLVGCKDLSTKIWMWPTSVVGFVRKGELDAVVAAVTCLGGSVDNFYTSKKATQIRYASA